MRSRVPEPWTRRELSQATGLSEGSIYNLEKGRRSPTLETLLSLVWALGLGSLDELLGPMPSSESQLSKPRP
ncbi:MAG: helix-turn-helix domain-containing protein [Gemmatimonadaceae bacterium]